MSKLNYPDRGLMSQTKAMFEECARSVSDAKMNCDLDVPGRYSKKEYLRNLDDKIRDYQSRLDDIREEIESADRDFSWVCTSASTRIRLIGSPKIDKRIRRII